MSKKTKQSLTVGMRDPLKHVIVGKADGTCIPAPEPALDAKVPEDSDMRGQFGPRTQDAIDKANQLLDDFSNLLQKKVSKLIDQYQLILTKRHQLQIGKR